MKKQVPMPAFFRLLAAVFFFPTAFCFSVSANEDLVLRCRWPSPNDRSPQEIVFSGNPLIVIPPGETFSVRAEAPDVVCRLAVIIDGQSYREDESLNFTAPQNSGAYYLLLAINAADRQRNVELCVLVPAKAVARRTGSGLDVSLEDRFIGHYPHPNRSRNAKVRANPDSYQPPTWWMQITEANASFEVMPGIMAQELVATSEDTGDRHTDIVPVMYPMWKAIVAVRNALEERMAVPGSALKLISVFRAPAYNRSIGSGAFSRHVYGDAFDFYLDLDNQGKAADLNRDGRLDRQDAYPLVALIESLQAEGKIPMGGIGVYHTVGGDHEVTLHLDLRGHRATWGFLTSPSGRRSHFSWLSKNFADIDRRDEEEAARRTAAEGGKYSPPRREPLP
ncbi:MAG: D-Ala-D-Ala carboxypeptidase family metallohydrolase [Planctomycetes bacterium]|nr:D-Ala-D-Ala carboxypeptidase family metallohydrolase [Planctomycetota bacterium]